jgi:hypothetical protein
MQFGDEDDERAREMRTGLLVITHFGSILRLKLLSRAPSTESSEQRAESYQPPCSTKPAINLQTFYTLIIHLYEVHLMQMQMVIAS